MMAYTLYTYNIAFIYKVFSNNYNNCRKIMKEKRRNYATYHSHGVLAPIDWFLVKSDWIFSLKNIYKVIETIRENKKNNLEPLMYIIKLVIISL